MHPDLQPIVPPGTSPLVVVRFQEGTPIRYEKNAELTSESGQLRDGWTKLKERFPTAALEPLFTHTAPERLRESVVPPPGLRGRIMLPVHDPTMFYSVRPESGQDIDGLIESLKALPGVVTAYPLRGPAPPPEFDPSTNPRAVLQGYLNPAPEGIDMFSAQTLPGADGSLVKFIDIEQGWDFNHEDLIDAHIQLLWGVNLRSKGHGTSVLGEIVATDNNKGIIGIGRGCRANAVSQFETLDTYNTAGAILAAIDHLDAGDVLLIEAQVDQVNRPGIYFPVEIEEPTLNALAIAFNKGIIVIEAAGNGNNRDIGENLDNLLISGRGNVLNRASNTFVESGAILVGAGSSGKTHRRLNFSNFGSRIDCYAWGENITTTGDGRDGQDPHQYIDNFGGTSGASPIIAGAAILIQSIQRALGGESILPEQMRVILADPATATLSENPDLDRIGVMPDLKNILQRLFLNPAEDRLVAIR
jgi:subtilisin family serine protease